jgi:hypothetical protein
MFKSALPILFLCCLAGCSESTTTPVGQADAASPRHDALGAGGASALGGSVASPSGGAGGGTGGLATGTGGGLGSGGTGSGGSLASGGASSVGGAVGTGAASSAGGKVGSGGASSVAGSSGGSTAAQGGQSGTGGATVPGGAPASGGRSASGGATSSGGNNGGGGSTAKGGTTASGGSSSTGLSCDTVLPTPTSKTTVSATINLSGTKDYGMQQFCADPDKLGDGNQGESQKPVFMLAANAVLKNVIIGGSGCSAADGVHCESGSCTLENVWFGDVGEDAISFKGSNASQVMTITGGGAFAASDKVIQHNGPGTIKISNFYVNTAGKLYRSCGNCGTQYARHVVMDHITAKSVKWLAGINSNYNDTATLTHITICGDSTVICEKYTGNDSGDEPTTIGSGPDSKNCLYSTSDITTL